MNKNFLMNPDEEGSKSNRNIISDRNISILTESKQDELLKSRIGKLLARHEMMNNNGPVNQENVVQKVHEKVLNSLRDVQTRVLKGPNTGYQMMIDKTGDLNGTGDYGSISKSRIRGQNERSTILSKGFRVENKSDINNNLNQAKVKVRRLENPGINGNFFLRYSHSQGRIVYVIDKALKSNADSVANTNCFLMCPDTLIFELKVVEEIPLKFIEASYLRWNTPDSSFLFFKVEGEEATANKK